MYTDFDSVSDNYNANPNMSDPTLTLLQLIVRVLWLRKLPSTIFFTEHNPDMSLTANVG